MAAMNRTCAFTGHRPNKLPWRYDETDSRCVALKAVLAEQIAAMAEAGFTQFLSGMAEAPDTWSALAVLSLREKNPAIKLHCILPCTAQAEKWSASSRDLYRLHLGTGRFCCLCQSGLPQKLYAGQKPFYGGTRLCPAGRLQRSAAKWDRRNCELCQEDGPGDHCD